MRNLYIHINCRIYFVDTALDRRFYCYNFELCDSLKYKKKSFFFSWFPCCSPRSIFIERKKLWVLCVYQTSTYTLSLSRKTIFLYMWTLNSFNIINAYSVNGSFILYFRWMETNIRRYCVCPNSIKNVWIMVFGHIELLLLCSPGELGIIILTFVHSVDMGI